MLTVIGALCAGAATIDAAAAIYCAMSGRLLQAWLLMVNFVILGSMVQFRVFG